MTDHSALIPLSELRSELAAFAEYWNAVSLAYDPAASEIAESVWQPGTASLKAAGRNPLTASESELAAAHAPALREWFAQTFTGPLSEWSGGLNDLAIWRKANSLQAKWLSTRESDIQEAVGNEVARLFVGEFAPLAAKVVKVLGRQHWPDEPPAPPEIPDVIRPDDLAADLFGIESNNSLEAGKLCLLWGAMAYEPSAFHRPVGWPQKVRVWARHLIAPIGKGNGYRSLGQAMGWAQDAFESLVAEAEAGPDWAEFSPLANDVPGQGAAVDVTDDCNVKPVGKKPKRSTTRGEGRDKLIAALTKHHKYSGGWADNLEPIGNNELARLADVDRATASAFFRKEFKGHLQYRARCGDPRSLADCLKALNGEIPPHEIYGRRLPDEREFGDG